MASAIHRCHHCGYETDLSNALAVFEENPHCRQCGLSAVESDSKMQDDLIDMMARNLQLSPIPPQAPHDDVSMPPTPQVHPQPGSITYITQHYHHSAHQAQPADVPVSVLLEQAGINADALLPSQFQLFKNAEPQQRSRLMALWQIAPPTYGSQMHPDGRRNWPATSMEQEEEAAQYRLNLSNQASGELSLATDDSGTVGRTGAEPYIVHGYGRLPNVNGVTAPVEYGSAATTTAPASAPEFKRSADPAYKSREWWNLSDDEPMEHQYGMLQQIYGYVDYSAARRNDGDADMS